MKSLCGFLGFTEITDIIFVPSHHHLHLCLYQPCSRDRQRLPLCQAALYFWSMQITDCSPRSLHSLPALGPKALEATAGFRSLFPMEKCRNTGEGGGFRLCVALRQRACSSTAEKKAPDLSLIFN